MRRPQWLAVVVLGQVAGVLLADAFGLRAVLALSLFAAAAWAKQGARWLPLALLAAAVAGVGHAASLHAAEAGPEGDSVVVDARIESRSATRAGLRWTLVLAAPYGGARAHLFVSHRDLERSPWIADAVPGESWRLGLRLRRLREIRNPGARVGSRAAARAGVGARAQLMGPRWAVRTATGGVRSQIERELLALRQGLGSSFADQGVGGALLRALVLGDRRDLGPIRDDFARLGVAHLLALSGLHLGLVLGGFYGVVNFVLRRSGWGGMGRDLRSAALVAALLAAVGYALLAGFGVPLRRALVFALAAAGSFVLRRPGGARSGFWLASSLVLATEPGALFDAGAQLSFAAAGALVFARAESASGFGLRVAATALAATTPVLAAHGLLATPVGLVANLLFVPWVGGVLLPLGIAAALGAEMPLVGGPLVEVAVWFAASTVEWAEAAAAALPGGPPVAPAPPLAVAALAVLGLVALGQRSTLARALLALGAVVLLRAWPVGPGPGADFAVFLDVGSGDATIVHSAGHTVLIDGGLAIPGGADLGRSRVLPALAALGVRRLDLVVASHADADHAGGLPAVLSALPVGEVWLPAGGAADPGFALLLGAAGGRDVPVKEVTAADPRRALGGGLTLQVLWPPEGFDSPDRNAGSIVLRVELGGVSLLLTGDLDTAGERALVAAGARVRADVLKLAHHGSATSTGPGWLPAVSPRAVVVSAACDRAGLPSEEVLARVRRRGVPLWWPARDGAITVSPAPLALEAPSPGTGCPGRRPRAGVGSEPAEHARGEGHDGDGERRPDDALATAQREAGAKLAAHTEAGGEHERGAPGDLLLDQEHGQGEQRDRRDDDDLDGVRGDEVVLGAAKREEQGDPDARLEGTAIGADRQEDRRAQWRWPWAVIRLRGPWSPESRREHDQHQEPKASLERLVRDLAHGSGPD